MHDAECPYCKEYVEINHDDGYGYDQDKLHYQDCSECGKTFTYYTSIYFSYSTEACPCLNEDSPHNYEKTKTYPPEFAKLRCTMCGDEKPLDYKF
jgi:hypothetical protein